MTNGRAILSRLGGTFRHTFVTARVNFPLRLLGFWYIGMLVMTQGPLHPRPDDLRHLMIGCFVWPVVAYLHAMTGPDSKWPERRNLVVDTLIHGIWLVELQFCLAGAAVLAGNVINNSIIGGWRRMIIHVLIMAAAVAVWGSVRGFEIRIEVTDATAVLFVLGIVAYTGFISILVRRQQDALRKSNRATREALAALSDANEELAEAKKNEALGALVAGLAHELNTPIGVCVTTSSHISQLASQMDATVRQGELSAEALNALIERARKATSLLSENLDRAAGLVLTFKELSAARVDERRRLIDLADHLQVVANMLRADSANDAIKLVTRVPASLEISSYPVVLTRILHALVENARLHAFPAHRGGTVTMRARAQREEIILEVIDDGVGIAANIQGHEFDPFVTTGRGRGSIGIGLSVVYNLVTQKLHGRIECLSTDAGTTMTIRLPRGDG